ncbi:porin family protein [Proteiniphilum sp. X52]|uniref:type IX secretion/gliding motility protein PorT/SprT n=1 Tax=Proteiniphilum sp. X52 TaxID=2382159 RepID=UPI000F09E3E8|nr:porin family protein [Proteiniphilum sp. X52]RNC64768.1 PorT family protein [Proteiniphilum sp. X52]
MIKKTTYFLLLILISGNLHSQQRKLQHRPYADQRLFHMGFTLGLHTQDLILTQSGFINENGQVWFSEIPAYSPGFTIGIIGDMYVNRFMNLRVIPSLYLGDKKFVFREQSSGEEFATHIRNNYITLPLHLKISAERINNFRPYLLVGGYGSLELASIKNRAVLLKAYDAGIEFGVGCDFYLPFFKLAPELKFSFGLVDMLEKERNDLKDDDLRKYANSLSKAVQRMITLSFHFE